MQSKGLLPPEPLKEPLSNKEAVEGSSTAVEVSSASSNGVTATSNREEVVSSTAESVDNSKALTTESSMDKSPQGHDDAGDAAATMNSSELAIASDSAEVAEAVSASTTAAAAPENILTPPNECEDDIGVVKVTEDDTSVTDNPYTAPFSDVSSPEQNSAQGEMTCFLCHVDWTSL